MLAQRRTPAKFIGRLREFETPSGEGGAARVYGNVSHRRKADGCGPKTDQAHRLQGRRGRACLPDDPVGRRSPNCARSRFTAGTPPPLRPLRHGRLSSPPPSMRRTLRARSVPSRLAGTQPATWRRSGMKSPCRGVSLLALRAACWPDQRKVLERHHRAQAELVASRVFGKERGDRLHPLLD